MDIKELNKKQLILLTLLITFVVSIATGIVTVTLMQQMPKAATQTINNVIQRTIEKVTTVQATTTTPTKDAATTFGDGDALVSVYSATEVPATNVISATTGEPVVEEPKELGQGIIISDVGLILIDSSVLTDQEVYKVILNKVDFDATVIKKFSNGFAILKITQKKVEEKPKDTTPTQGASAATPKVDIKQ